MVLSTDALELRAGDLCFGCVFVLRGLVDVRTDGLTYGLLANFTLDRSGLKCLEPSLELTLRVAAPGAPLLRGLPPRLGVAVAVH